VDDGVLVGCWFTMAGKQKDMETDDAVGKLINLVSRN
jgi:hypothetical protein